MARKRMGNVAAASLAASGSINFTDGSFLCGKKHVMTAAVATENREIYISQLYSTLSEFRKDV